MIVIAKSVKEKITTTHKLDAEGYLNLDGDTGIEVEEKGFISFRELLKNFNGSYIKISITDKVEKEIDE